MKKLMLGNQAIARGLYEAGCRFVSSYPGTPSTEITEQAAGYEELYTEWAPNEKVAFEVAFGAATAGARAFCAMKHVGLNVAADPLYTASYIGANGGTDNGSLVTIFIKNPNVVPELSMKYNIGIDATLFHGLNLTVDAFMDKRSNILTLDNSRMGYYGKQYVFSNDGEMTNKGV